MSGRIRWLLPVVAAAVLVASGAASTPSGPSLGDVATANTKSAGYAPASMLSPELQQVAVAQGSTRVENPTSAVAYYGYDSDVVNAAGEPVMTPAPGTTSLS